MVCIVLDWHKVAAWYNTVNAALNRLTAVLVATYQQATRLETDQPLVQFDRIVLQNVITKKC